MNKMNEPCKSYVETLFEMRNNSFIQWHRNPKCIVLDLDETLIHSKPGNITKKSSKVPIHNINIEGDMWSVIERPHLKDFVNFIYKYFDLVIIWSAGTYEYVHAICKLIFPYYDECIVYTRDDCINENGNYIKPLIELEKNEYLLSPIMNLRTMFVVDNLDDTFVKNVSNAIHIPNFEPEPSDLPKIHDVALLKLISYFSELNRDIDDIRLIDKNIFQQNK